MQFEARFAAREFCLVKEGNLFPPIRKHATISVMANIKVRLAATTPEGLFQAFSDRTRLRLLCLLRRGERCVCDLVDALQLPQPTVSRHLSSLKQSGLLISRKEGLWCHYRLARPTTPLHIMLVGSLEAVAAELSEVAADENRMSAERTSCP